MESLSGSDINGVILENERRINNLQIEVANLEEELKKFMVVNQKMQI